MGKRVSFVVSFEIPAGATITAVKEYIREEVMAGCGGKHPDDPMSGLNRDSVRVKTLPKPKTT